MILPPPPVNGRRHPAFFDTECFPNYWLLKVRPKGGAVFTWRLLPGQRFTTEQARDIDAMLNAYAAISFNGLGYDVWMIGCALSGYSCEELKLTNDRIIVPKGMPRVKPWELGLPRWEPSDHIDLMEVAPGAGSLKQYAARIHSKRVQDLPYSPHEALSPEQVAQVDAYCENDLAVLEHLYNECEPLLQLREALGQRYGLDLRSKSDAQVAEVVLRHRCEQATGRRIYRGEGAAWQSFRYRMPSFIAYSTAELQHMQRLVADAVFALDDAGKVMIPEALQNLVIHLGQSAYKIGNGGLHSQEKCIAYVADAERTLLSFDVASYYPQLMLNSGEWPPALGEPWRKEYADIKAERLAAKDRQGKLKKAGDTSSADYVTAKTMNEGGKIMINGTFGKTGSPYSVLFAPSMLIQTTLTGQLSLLMLIEWLELYGIPVVSANTDGIVTYCRREQADTARHLVREWERRVNLDMDEEEFRGTYSRDVNCYFAITASGDVKRKGDYAKAGLVEKKNPDTEICSDAVAEFLARGMPVEATIFACTDIRKFVTVQKVDGGGVKMWGEGPRKTDKVRDMVPRLQAHGWHQVTRGRWAPMAGEPTRSAAEAYALTFAPQVPEYLGKVVRWYYGTRSPGPIVYASRNATVSLSHGAQPCMTLPDTLPNDIDYQWYIDKAYSILNDIGYRRGVGHAAHSGA